MSEKILLIDGHSILNRAFYGLPGSDQFRRAAYRSCLWFPEYYFKNPGRREAKVSDGSI